MRLIDADALWNKQMATMATLVKSVAQQNLSSEALSLLCGTHLISEAPTVDAIAIEPLAEWLAGYADPPKYAMEIIPDSGKCLVNARAKAWEHHLRTMMECGLMEEGEHE